MIYGLTPSTREYVFLREVNRDASIDALVELLNIEDWAQGFTGEGHFDFSKVPEDNIKKARTRMEAMQKN